MSRGTMPTGGPARAAASAANRATIERLYAALAALDGDAMQACYATEAHFADEVFKLQGARRIGGMWRMLCSATRDKGQAQWKIETRDIHADARRGRAHWDAHYLFAATGRTVLNRIDAEFEFDHQARITRQRDRFDFWSWSRQALGTPGWLLGWTPVLRSKVRRQAAARLEHFMHKSPGAPRR